jgi:uncharacterized protein involved in exopolysaccharide biosynthesis
MNHAESGSLSLGYFLGVLFRHKKKSLLTFFGFCLLAIFIALFLPRTYLSKSKIYVRIGRESITLDPTATTGQTVMMQKSQESEINSVLDILDSRQIKETVVEQLGTDQVLEAGNPPNFVLAGIDSTRSAVGGLLDSFTASTSDGTTDESLPSVKEELAIRRLGRTTWASAAKNSNVITIAAKAGSPKVAQSIAQATLDAFIQEHLRLNRTEGSFEFFVDQTRRMEAQLAAKQAQLQKMKSEFQLLSVEGKREALQAKLSDIELAAVHTERQLAYAHAKIKETDQAIEQIDRLIVTESESGFNDMAHANMRQKLYELEIREAELLQTYVATHPMVLAVREQRKGLAEILDQHPKVRTQTTSALNPTWQAVKLELEQERVDALALEAQQLLLEKQLKRARRDLEELNAQEVQLAVLQREVDMADANYRIHTEKLEQARIDSELGSQDISSVNVVQPASYVRKPISPKKSLVLPAGFVLGLLGALGIALISEYFDNSLRTAEQTEAHLGLPVVTTIPQDSRFERERSMRGSRHGSSR